MQLPKIIAKTKVLKELAHLLSAVLTPKEQAEIERRIVILQRLEKGEAQHELAESLGVGIATITRGSKVLKTKSYQAIKHLL